MVKITLIFLLCCASFASHTQSIVNGRVVDQTTGESMAFVTIIEKGQQQGAYSDIDGKFSIGLKSDAGTLVFSFVGYESRQVDVSSSADIFVKLNRKVFHIDEAVVFPGINPAHRIIDAVIANKDKNNPEKGSTFSYESYNKFIFTGQLDSALMNAESMAELDSSTQALKEIFDEQHLLLIESVSERKFKPPNNDHEEIIASRFSGLQNPEFVFLASQLQSFSLYEELIHIADNSYLSPICNGATRKYLFLIEDTSYVGVDTVFSISFRPRSGKNFDGLKGVLHINNSSWAIQHAIAEPVETNNGLSIKIQQKYEFIQGEKWFPVQLNSFIYFSELDLRGMNIIGIGRSYLKNIQLGEKYKNRDFNHIAIEIDPKASSRDDGFWNRYRSDSLDSKELRTYEVIDSIGKAENFDAKMKILGALIYGEISIGKFNIPLHRLVDYNLYEGFRLGAGLTTNQSFSKFIKPSGYFAYGTVDKQWKYGGELTLHLYSQNEVSISGFYKRDVLPFGGWTFNRPTLPLAEDSYWKLMIDRMDNIESIGGEISFRSFRHLSTRLYLNQEKHQIDDGYAFRHAYNENITALISEFQITEIGGKFRFAPGEKFMQSGDRLFSMGTNGPVFFVNYAQGFTVFNGDFDYQKLEIMFDYSLQIPKIGEFSTRIVGAFIDGDIPLSIQYNMRGTYDLPGLATEFSFETMRPSEFFATRFASIHLRHNFRDLLYKTENFQPHISVVANYAIGEMEMIDSHSEIAIKSLDKGYLEAGVQVDRLLILNISGLGLGIFYRIGNYALPNTLDNFAFKLAFEFVF